MRYTLKDYQDDAVGDVLRNLREARDDWHQKRRPVSFSLTATTGAGKTVMAAAVIEALFDGNADYDFIRDPGAVVLWFTDDPSLNEQTRSKLIDAADRIALSRLLVIENTFNQEKLHPGTVYFLNSQKLGKNSLLVRGTPSEDPVQSTLENPAKSDSRAFTMWDTVANTIADERLTLYLILDEAHRGMKAPTKSAKEERATIVQRLVNGAHGVPPMPIVWGDLSHRRAVRLRDGESEGPNHLSADRSRFGTGPGVGAAEGRHPLGIPRRVGPVRHGALATSRPQG